MTRNQTLSSRFYGLGRMLLLAGILFTLFAVSMMVGMRFAIRGQEVETPSLIGMSVDAARRAAQEQGLGMSVTGRRYDSTTPEDAVVAQVPTPGVGIKAGRDVRVVVSLGPRVNPVPDLQGTTLRAARLLVEQQGYTIGMVSEIRAEGEAGRILAQWPPPLSNQHLDNRLAVLVSAPLRPAFVMPVLTGLNLNRAMRLLEAEGFQTRVFYRDQTGVLRGTVVRQFPEPGHPLVEGDTINLEVSR